MPSDGTKDKAVQQDTNYISMPATRLHDERLHDERPEEILESETQESRTMNPAIVAVP